MATKKTAWEKAKAEGLRACPLRVRPGYESEEHKAMSEDEQDARWDEDYNRGAWAEGYAYGKLGVPDSSVADRDDRWFWQGYEAGVAAQ